MDKKTAQLIVDLYFALESDNPMVERFSAHTCGNGNARDCKLCGLNRARNTLFGDTMHQFTEWEN